AGVVDDAHERLPVGVQVLDGPPRHAGGRGSFGDRRRDLDDQARVEGLGNDVFRPEGQVLVGVGAGDFGAAFGLRQFGDGLDAGELHLLVDDGGAAVHRAAEDEGKAQYVVDLVRVVGPAGGDDAVGPGGLGVFRADFGIGVGQGKDQRAVGHGAHHVLGQHARGRAAQEDIGALADVGQGAGVGLLRVAGLVGLHLLVAAFPDHAAGIDHENVLPGDAELDDQVQAGDGGGAGARAHELDLADVLAHDLQAVQDGGRGNDGGAVLVVVEDGDLHALAQLLLDVEAFRRLDVFEVDPAQRGLQRGDDVDQLVRVVLVQLDVEDVDAGEFLEQAALAFHDGLGGQGADVAQAEHGRAVGHHPHQIGARGIPGS